MGPVDVPALHGRDIVAGEIYLHMGIHHQLLTNHIGKGRGRCGQIHFTCGLAPHIHGAFFLMIPNNDVPVIFRHRSAQRVLHQLLCRLGNHHQEIPLHMAVVCILAQVVFVYKQILHHLRQELHGKRCVCFTLKTAEVQCVDIFFGGVVVALISIGPGAIQIHQHEFGPGGKGVLRAAGAAIRGAGVDPLVKIEVLDLLSRVIIRILYI